MKILVKGKRVNGRFEFQFPYDKDKIQLCKDAGCHYDAHRRLWHTPDAKIAALLDQTLAEEKKVAYKPFMGGEYDFLADYQRVGAQALCDNERFILGDDMGLGKTAQVIAAMNGIEPKRILILCPATLTSNWRNEIQKFGSDWLKSRSISINADDQISICSYDSSYRKLGSNVFDLVVLDEVHKIKGKSKRAKFVIGGKVGKTRFPGVVSERIWALSGTPLQNRPNELWNLITLIDPCGLGKNWFGFHKRYCAARKTRWGMDVSGASNKEELSEKLSKFMLRRLKTDELNLPPKIRSFIELEPDARQSKALYRELQVGQTVTGRNFVDQESSWGFAELSEVRQKVGLMKVKPVVDFCQDILEAGEKVIIFAHHIDVVNAYCEAFENSVKIVGGMTQKQKDLAVDEFQNGDAQVLVGNMNAAGVGLTLTAASKVVFGEIDWVPATLEQAEDRAYRYGQKETVNVYYFSFKGSLDEQILNAVFSKQHLIGKIVKKS